MKFVSVSVVLSLFAFLTLSAAAADKDPKTERVWKAKCASCHGVDGKADTEQAKKMAMHDITTAAWQKSFTNEQIKKVILDGVDEQKDGKHKQMDPYKAKLKPEQIDALVLYCRALAK